MPLRVVPRRDRKLNRLIKKGESRSFRKGEVVFSTGALAREIFLVRSGYVRLVAGEGTPSERTVALAGPWEVTGEEALLPGIRRRTTALAGERAQVTVLEGQAVNRVLRTSERTFQAFVLAAHNDLALTWHLASSRGTLSARARLATLLDDLVHRWGRAVGSKTHLPVRLTHQILADVSGIHRSTVTTILNDLIYVGILAQEGGSLWVLEPRALADLMAGPSRVPLPGISHEAQR